MDILKREIEEIQKYRWNESERLGRDIGRNTAAQEWIQKNAKSFREYWEKRLREQESEESGGISP
jgi:hypothetical protein